MTVIKSYPREMGEEVVIKIWTRKSFDDTKWEIVVSGLPDFEVISNDVDDLKIISRRRGNGVCPNCGDEARVRNDAPN